MRSGRGPDHIVVSNNCVWVDFPSFSVGYETISLGNLGLGRLLGPSWAFGLSLGQLSSDSVTQQSIKDRVAGCVLGEPYGNAVGWDETNHEGVWGCEGS